jgi:hypothetical protein
MTPQAAIEVIFLVFPVVGLGVALVVALWKVSRRRQSGLSPRAQYEREAAELRASGYLRRSGYAGGVWGIGAGGYLGGSGGCGAGGHGGHGGCGGGAGCGGGGCGGGS